MDAPEAVQVLTFGSRTGSLVGMGIMAMIVGVIGLAAAQLSRQRRVSFGLGIGVFLALFGLVYASTFGGFYEAELRRGEIALTYLIDPRVRTIPLASVREFRPYFAYKMRWRMDIETNTGKRYTSASGNRGDITEAAEQLNQALRRSREDG